MTKSYRFAALLATVALALGATTAFAHDGGGDNHGHGNKGHRHGGDVLRSDLFGSQVAPTGPVLFGVNPGDAPWVIARGEARVRRNGRVKVRVEGLVIPTPPSNGTNPLSNIAASVYCGGTLVATTDPVPFSPAGDARIDATGRGPEPVPGTGRPAEPGAGRRGRRPNLHRRQRRVAPHPRSARGSDSLPRAAVRGSVLRTAVPGQPPHPFGGLARCCAPRPAATVKTTPHRADNGTTMTAETTTLTRELDRRLSDGIEVRLLWRPHDDVCLVAVSDARTQESFAIEVRPGEKPTDVFHHPYAYAASRPKLAAIAS